MKRLTVRNIWPTVPLHILQLRTRKSIPLDEIDVSNPELWRANRSSRISLLRRGRRFPGRVDQVTDLAWDESLAESSPIVSGTS